MHLSIIIPLYNEKDLVIHLLDQLISVKYPEFVQHFEIIIIDDCSTDNSYQLVKEYIAEKQNFKLFKHTANKGKGAAVRTGIGNAKGDVYLIQDADLELSPSDIPAMLITMEKMKVQFVNGSRYLPGVIRPLSSYKRYLANKFFTFITSVLIDVKLTDMACGYKLIHKDLYQQIILKENRFGFEAELILKALKIKRNNIVEVPVHYFPRNKGEGKKLSVKDGLKILWVITKYGLFG
mgnify:CR=1 FL=1